MNNSKSRIIYSFLKILCPVLLIAGVLIYIFYSSGWTAGVVCIYLLVGAVGTIYKLILLKNWSASTTQGTILKTIFFKKDNKDKIETFLYFANTILQPMISFTAGFLPNLYHLIPGKKRLRFPDMIEPQVLLSICTCIFINILFALFIFFNLHNKYLYLLLWVILINLWLRHLSFLICTPSLPIILKEYPGTPQLRFFMIAAADLLSVILLLTAIVHWDSLSTASYTLIPGVLKNILTFKGFFSIFQSEKYNLEKLVNFISVFLYTAFFFKNLFQRKEFKRTPEDFATLAAYYISINDYDKTRTCLLNTNSNDIRAIIVSCMYFIGLNNFQKAYEKAGKLLSHIGEEETESKTFEIMIGFSFFLNLSEKSAMEILNLGVSKRIDDITLLSGAINFINRMDNDAYNSLLSFVLDRENNDEYPLTLAGILIHLGRFKQGKQILNELRPVQTIEMVCKHCLLFSTCFESKNISIEKFEAECFNWADESLPVILEVVPTIEDTSQIRWVYSQIKGVSSICQQHEYVFARELMNLASELEEKMDPNLLTDLHVRCVNKLGPFLKNI